MINLLPDETKKQLKAARTNTILVRYILTVVIAAVFLGLAIFTSYYIMNGSKTTAENAITDVKSSNDSYSPTITKSNAFIADLSTAKNTLNRQISYSTIIKDLIGALPTSVILKSPFSLDNDILSAPITITAYAKSSSDEATLKTNLQGNSTFSGYSLQSLNNNTDASSKYPFIITFSITISGTVSR